MKNRRNIILNDFILKIKMRLLKSKIFYLSESIFGFPYEKRKFSRKHGYRLNLNFPRTFNEKVVVKKIRDRNPLLPITADKYYVKSFLSTEFGAKWASHHLIETIDYGTNVKSFRNELPEEYIIKGTHLSGTNLIKTKEDFFCETKVNNHIRKILKTQIYTYSNSWLYSKITPGYIIEPLIRDEKNEIPKDYKFFCMHGKTVMIQLDSGRFKEMTRSLFDASGQLINARTRFPHGPKSLSISNFEDVKKFVESLAFNLDFVRVDIYLINDKPIFGELTHYPGGGHSPISYEIDLFLGNLWNLSY